MCRLSKVADRGRRSRPTGTQGSKETRTINLPKGTYRVVVKAKYGYAETPSAPVYLKR